MITLDTSSVVPPSEQIRAQIADAIRSGSLRDGDRLPSVRQLAADLGIAPGTVARAYAQLDTAELTVSSRRGTRVKPSPQLDDATREAAAALVAAGRSVSADLDDLLAAVRTAWRRAD